MNHENFSEAVGEISPALIEDAAQVYEKNGHRKARVLRVAAIAAVLAILLTALSFWPAREESYITGPGVLKVYACELEDKDEFQLAEYALIEGAEPSYQTLWSPHLNLTSMGITISLLVNEETLHDHDITFDVICEYGELSTYMPTGNPWTPDSGSAFVPGESVPPFERIELEKKATVNNNITLYWEGTGLPYSSIEAMSKIGNVYVDVIIKADGNIVGYALLEMVYTNDVVPLFRSALKTSVYYPKVDGDFQKIDEAYVLQQIEVAKGK